MALYLGATIFCKLGGMLTDNFAYRYEDVPMWEEFGARDSRLIVQAYRIINEQLFPPMVDGKKAEWNEEKWKILHDKMSTELGLNELAQRWYSYKDDAYGKTFTRRGNFDWSFIGKTYVCTKYEDTYDPDVFIKNRLSFIEIAFREKENDLAERRRKDPTSTDELFAKLVAYGKQIEPGNKPYALRVLEHDEAEFQSAVDELNERFRQAGYKLNYHNGFIQIVGDEKVEEQIETPFWALVADAKWKNVETDMATAIDMRDTGGPDPGWYAARALESVIKIISDEKKWTHGGENGAANFIDNLAARKNGHFIEAWESETLRQFFSKLRNPFGHGAGSAEMPKLSDQQTNWAIEFCMSWTKSLIERL